MLKESAAVYKRAVDVADELEELVRSAVFSREVRWAHQSTCAVLGLQLLSTTERPRYWMPDIVCPKLWATTILAAIAWRCAPIYPTPSTGTYSALTPTAGSGWPRTSGSSGATTMAYSSSMARRWGCLRFGPGRRPENLLAQWDS